MLPLIDQHMTQWSKVARRRSLCGCLNPSQLKNIFCYSKLYFLSIMLIRPSTVALTYTSGPANVPNLLISREFLPSTQDMNLQANIFRWLCWTHCQWPCGKASRTRLYQHDQYKMPSRFGRSVAEVSWSGSIGDYSNGGSKHVRRDVWQRCGDFVWFLV